MSQNNSDSPRLHCPRFGQLAVNLGYLSAEQLKQGLSQQVDDNLAGRPHRVLGDIFIERGWLTAGQVDEVLKEMFKLIKVFEQQAG